MIEQEPRSQDISGLIDRGGLTIDHWKELVLRGRAGFPTDYARYVIMGKFPDTGLYHKQFLGRRNWESIARGLNTQDEIEIPRRFVPWPKTELVDNSTALQIRDYATHEAASSYTLDDYFYRVFTGGPDIGNYRRRLADGVWEEKYTWTKEEFGKHELYEGGHYFTVTGPYTSSYWDYRVHGDQSFFVRKLLRESEVAQVSEDERHGMKLPQGYDIEVSDWDLQKRVRKLALENPEKFRQRLIVQTPDLAHLHDIPTFGILQKEIPATYNHAARVIAKKLDVNWLAKWLLNNPDYFEHLLDGEWPEWLSRPPSDLSE